MTILRNLPQEEVERYFYGWNGEMDPDEYFRLWSENLAAREAFHKLAFYKRLWEEVRGRKPKPWQGVAAADNEGGRALPAESAPPSTSELPCRCPEGERRWIGGICLMCGGAAPP